MDNTETNNEDRLSEQAGTTQNQPSSTDSIESPQTANNTSGNKPDQISGKKRFYRNRWVWVIVLVLVVGAGLSGYYYYQHRHKTSHTPVTAAKSTPKKVAESTNLAADSFFETAQKINTDLGFFKDTTDYFGTSCANADGTDCTPLVTPSDISYYQIGTTAKKQPIVVAEDYSAGEGSFAYIAIETTTGQYSIIGKLLFVVDPSDPNSQANLNQQEQSFEQALSSNVTLDSTTNIQELLFPTSATINNLPLKSSADNAGYFLPSLAYIRGTYFSAAGGTAAADITKLGSADSKTFYEVTAEDSDNYQVKEIYATLNQIYAASYNVVDNLTANKASITWSDGTSNQNTYTFSPLGCGSPNGYLVAKNIAPNQLSVIGTGPDKQQLYSPATSSALFNELYSTDYAGGTGLENTSLENLTVGQFQSAHAFFLAKNALGEYVIYERADTFPRGGCGKPVIYLYPKQPTSVSVRVAANITQSDPIYPENGWQNVLAQPNGALTYQGKSYNSLYWEGTGLGVYPAINAGTVVSSKDAVQTIRAQLTEQGLSRQETDDFLAFWEPKLPGTPYVRLTWFNTNQMNNLAPLSISPKPDTLIRVFLDFQGLNKPISLPAQKLTALKRQGFTVVEWGGLLRDTGQ